MTTRESSNTGLIGIDWGTSRLRAFRISAEGEELERRDSALGVAKVRDGDFDTALRGLIGDWQDGRAGCRIILCGMVGSRQGWREVPYRRCPAGLTDLLGETTRIETSLGPAWIVCGLSVLDREDHADIMRGEETQILGAMPFTGRHRALVPGTHSKWAVIEDGRITGFRTWMTGELFDVMCRHSSLGWLMAGEAPEATDDGEFLTGVRHALATPDLLHSMFRVRTQGLLGAKTAGQLASFLSGLLIGSEIAGESRREPAGPVTVIASAALARLYGLALAEAGFSAVSHVDASDAAIRGLWRLSQEMGMG